MTQLIRFKRGNEVNLSQLATGEPAFTLDSHKFFIGTSEGNVEIAPREAFNALEKQFHRMQAEFELQKLASERIQTGGHVGIKANNQTLDQLNVEVDTDYWKTTMICDAGLTDFAGKVTSVSGAFATGERVTITGRQVSDDVIVQETVTFTEVTGTSSLVFTPALTKAYKSGATISRTTMRPLAGKIQPVGIRADVNVDKNAVNAQIGIGFNVADSPNRNDFIILKNGWIVKLFKYPDTSPYLQYYVSKDGGTGWEVLTFTNIPVAGRSPIHYTMMSKGNNVYTLAHWNDGSTYFLAFDAEKVLPVTQNLIKVFAAGPIDNGGGIDFAFNTTKTEIHFVVSSIFTNNTNGQNLYYGILPLASDNITIPYDGTSTTVPMEKLTTWTNSTYPLMSEHPSIFIGSDNIPVIIFNQPNVYLNASGTATGLNQMTLIRRDSTLNLNSVLHPAWTYKVLVMPEAGLEMTSPHVTYVPPGVTNTKNGRVLITWTGDDVDFPAYKNLKFMYSDDLGYSWKGYKRLTAHSENQILPQISTSPDGRVMFVWRAETVESPNADVLRRMYIENWGEGSVSAIEDIPVSTVVNGTSNLVDCEWNHPSITWGYMYREATGYIWRFTGKYTTLTDTGGTLKNQLRFKTLSEADEVVLIVKHVSGATITGLVNGVAMSASTIPSGTETELYVDLSEYEQVAAILNFEIEVTRTEATADAYITDIVGGIF